MNKTLIIIKPHAVQRRLIGRIMTRFEDLGLEITQAKLFQAPPELWHNFYPSDDGWFTNAGSKTLDSCRRAGIDVEKELGTSDPLQLGKMIKQWLVDHMSSGPCLAAILEGNDVAAKVRLVCGKTLPNDAAPGTIRFDFSTDSPALANREKRPVYNLIHASDPEEKGAFEKESALVFGNT